MRIAKFWCGVALKVILALLLLTTLLVIMLCWPVEHEQKQNQMVDGCVMQKSGNNWIRTCG